MNQGFVVIVPPSMAVDLARECDRTGVAVIRQEKDGVQVIRVTDWDAMSKLDRDARTTLRLVSDMRFKVVELLTAQEPPQLERLMADRRLHNSDHMAQLRKRTGQDWRGRR